MNVENAQFALNNMVKILRTSGVVNESESQLKVFNYASNDCVEYTFAGNRLKRAVKKMTQGESFSVEEVAFIDRFVL